MTITIKIKPCDKWFSWCIRGANDWRCERCNGAFEEGTQGLHCSHIFSRRHRTIRWCKDNAQSLCANCHQWFGGNPVESGDWVKRYMGQHTIDNLLEKKRRYYKISKSQEKEIAAFYKNQYEQIKEKRMNGETGYIDFESYQ